MKFKNFIKCSLIPFYGLTLFSCTAISLTLLGCGKTPYNPTYYDFFTYTLNADGSSYEIGVNWENSTDYVKEEFNQNVVIPNVHPIDGKPITVIGKSFLSGCESFNSNITFPNTVIIILNDFLSGCTNFNKPIILPENIVDFRAGFLCNCESFNQDLYLHKNITHYERFLQNAFSFCSKLYVDLNVAGFETSEQYVCACNTNECDLYEIGVTVKGLNADLFKAKFKNSDVYPFRRLI